MCMELPLQINQSIRPSHFWKLYKLSQPEQLNSFPVSPIETIVHERKNLQYDVNHKNRTGFIFNPNFPKFLCIIQCTGVLTTFKSPPLS